MTDSDSTKICSKCHRELNTNDFHKHPTGKNGLRPDCRDCVSSRRREYYMAHQKEMRAYSANYYQNNREQTIKANKKYAARNKSRTATRSKRWREANQEKVKADKRLDYVRNFEKYARLKRKYAASHPEHAKVSTHKRRARLRVVQGTFTAAQWVAKCEYFGWRCYLCGVVVSGKTAQPDHRRPISRGGLNWISNVAPACASCNLSKSKKTEAEYRDHICSQKLPTVSVAAREVIPYPRNATGLLPSPRRLI